MTLPAPPALRCTGVSVAYDGHVVLRGIDLELRSGETFVLLGPSASGKTTLLHVVGGLLAPQGGSIELEGRVVARGRLHVPPEERRIAMVFQQYALWPHLSALETVAYPLRRQGVAAAEARARADRLLQVLGVGDLADRRPASLSGGEQQRVGVARALARDAALVLLDEPTAHLDTPLRTRLLAELADQRSRSGAAALYATHDVSEALAVADRVGVLRDGRLVQEGSPRDIYEQPMDPWVARLSGPASVLRATFVARDGGQARLRVADLEVQLPLHGATAEPGATVELLVRPDWAALGGELRGRVASVLYRGPHTDYRLETAAGELELRAPGPPRLQPGAETGWTLERGWIVGSG